MIAGLVGAPEKAERLISDMQLEIEAVRKTCITDIPVYSSAEDRDVRKLRVYCEEWGKPLIHSQFWVKELVEAAGGEFIGEPGKHTEADTIRAVDPDVVIAAWCGAGDRVPLEKIIRERHWEHMSAARNRRVYCIRDEYLNTPAPTLISGLHSLALAIHPDKFNFEFTRPRQISPLDEAIR
jgi:iron complex transport system substrate-binding protein